MKDVIEFLKEHNALRIIDNEVDVDLEIGHISYIETKKEHSQALLFTNVVNKAKNITYDMPVLTNIFANQSLTKKIFDNHPDAIAKEIEALLHMKPPSGFGEKISMFQRLFNLKSVFPKKLKSRGIAQEVVFSKEEVDLDRLPILKTWEHDGGPFITMGQVYTKDLNSDIQNVGMYRLQQFDKTRLGMHWQIHKDGAHFFHDYKEAGKKMPVTVAIGGDPLYIWCGQAPLPNKIFELLLYGFVRGKNPRLVKSLTNDIYVPEDVDIIIEGFVDTSKMELEGEFGDHTGYYTLKEPYPFMEVETITMRKKPTFCATVVGKPPIEDKHMGWATERIFLPLLKTTAPELIDYNMPENGTFHNLILAKMKPYYKGHAKQFMHSFWGVGQMSFVRHAIFVDDNAPALDDYENLTYYILNRLTPKTLLITEGVIDALDHASNESLVGGKLGIDCTGEELKSLNATLIEDATLLAKMQSISGDIVSVKQYFKGSKNPITIIAVNKTQNQKALFKALKPLYEHLKIMIFVDSTTNSVDNLYMLVWRVTNNIEATRDIFIEGDRVAIDATNKNSLDNFEREWPRDVLCSKEVLERLKARKLIDIDDAFVEHFGLL